MSFPVVWLKSNWSTPQKSKGIFYQSKPRTAQQFNFKAVVRTFHEVTGLHFFNLVSLLDTIITLGNIFCSSWHEIKELHNLLTSLAATLQTWIFCKMAFKANFALSLTAVAPSDLDQSHVMQVKNTSQRLHKTQKKTMLCLKCSVVSVIKDSHLFLPFPRLKFGKDPQPSWPCVKGSDSTRSLFPQVNCDIYCNWVGNGPKHLVQFYVTLSFCLFKQACELRKPQTQSKHLGIWVAQGNKKLVIIG